MSDLTPVNSPINPSLNKPVEPKKPAKERPISQLDQKIQGVLEENLNNETEVFSMGVLLYQIHIDKGTRLPLEPVWEIFGQNETQDAESPPLLETPPAEDESSESKFSNKQFEEIVENFESQMGIASSETDEPVQAVIVKKPEPDPTDLEIIDYQMDIIGNPPEEEYNSATPLEAIDHEESDQDEREKVYETEWFPEPLNKNGLEYLIWKMLRLHPEERISGAEALKKYEELTTKERIFKSLTQEIEGKIGPEVISKEKETEIEEAFENTLSENDFVSFSALNAALIKNPLLKELQTRLLESHHVVDRLVKALLKGDYDVVASFHVAFAKQPSLKTLNEQIYELLRKNYSLLNDTHIHEYNAAILRIFLQGEHRDIKLRAAPDSNILECLIKENVPSGVSQERTRRTCEALLELLHEKEFTSQHMTSYKLQGLSSMFVYDKTLQDSMNSYLNEQINDLQTNVNEASHLKYLHNYFFYKAKKK